MPNLFSLMFADTASGADDPTWGWVQTVLDAINDVLWPILIVVSAAGMIYAIVLGVNMVRADSPDKRDEAKKRLINVVIGLAVIIALILFFKLVITVIIPAFGGPKFDA